MYDLPLWESIRAHQMALQCCADCENVWYPPAPVCPNCLSPRFQWKAISGTGEILSWVVFHRQYFDDFPAPYNVVAVKLNEGPIFLTNLAGDPPAGSWIGMPVRIEYETRANGDVLPVAVLTHQ
jgi:uncharacterized OB-fold protein